MTSLGETTRDRQIAVVYLTNVAIGAARSPDESRRRVDVAKVPRDVLSGLFERLRYAGATWRMEGRFLVMGR